MRLLFQLFLYVLLIFTIILLLTSKREVFGIRSFTVLTNSMKPSLSAGSLIVIQKYPQYKKGDVVTFNKGDVEITHRIVAIKKNRTNTLYQTKGDANTVPDNVYISQNNVLGKVIFVLPFIGRIAQFLKTVPGLFLFILLPGLLFILMELRAIHKEIKIRVVIFISIICSLLVLSNATTFSFVNDIAYSSENTFYALPISASEPIADHTVISEVQTSGATASQDFVELYNPTSQIINLSGWRIRKKTSAGTISTLVTITTGKSIPAHGYFLWSNSTNGYDNVIGADISNTNTLSDNNSIDLQTANGVTVDQLGWGTGTNQFFEGSIISANPTALHSIERKARASSSSTDMMTEGADSLAGNGVDTDNNLVDFIIRSQSEPQNSLSPAESI